MLIEVDGNSFDLSSVCHIGKVGGDPSWLRYVITFDNGRTFEIMENRVDVGMQMKRKDLHKLWVEARFKGVSHV